LASLTFHGAAAEVTGSCHLLESESCGRILLDCGMHQGGDAVERLRDESFAFSPDSVDAVVLSHAHLDHSGLLPRLVHEGFSGPIYCTSATAELLEIMLKDAVGLYLRDLDRSNLRRARRGLEAEDPVYSESDVAEAIRLCRGVDYGHFINLGSSAQLCFHDAGHILGSAIIEVALSEGEASKTVVFTGDLGKADSVLMNPPAQLSSADVVIMESTYGDREHRGEQDSVSQLRDVLAETWQKGGSVMIPSFAVGRTQDVLFHLGCLHHSGELDNWEVFLDSPMAISVTRAYDHWLGILNSDDVRALGDAHRSSLETFLPKLSLATTTEESMAINRIKSGAIIIAGSGMCTGGRIRHHFKHRIYDDRNAIVFTGFQAQGTLGRKIVDGAERVRMFGDDYVVKARVETLGGLSAHAGQSELVDWIGGFSPPPRTLLVHGEPRAQAALAARISNEHNLEVEIPQRGQSIAF